MTSGRTECIKQKARSRWAYKLCVKSWRRMDRRQTAFGLKYRLRFLAFIVSNKYFSRQKKKIHMCQLLLSTAGSGVAL